MLFKKKKVVFGATEDVIFPTLGGLKITAKVDTGAWNGALHVDNLIVKDKVLFFTIDNQKFSRKKFHKTVVTSSNGQKETRYVVTLKIEINDREYSTKIGLTNRANMKYKMLLGRKFLSKNNVLIKLGE